jgi:hypothetical protein
MKQAWRHVKLSVLCTIAAVALVACGGGGGSAPSSSTTLSGVAAGGAPLVGTVYIKDSKGVEKSTTIDLTANGAYTFDVAGLTPPFVLKAIGTVGNTQVTYCSVATAADVGGNINITPFTDLIVANIASQVAVNFYGNGDPAKITTTAIATQA